MFVWWLSKTDCQIIGPNLNINEKLNYAYSCVHRDLQSGKVEKILKVICPNSCVWQTWGADPRTDNYLGIKIEENKMSLLPKVGFITQNNQIYSKHKTNYVELAVSLAKQYKQQKEYEDLKLKQNELKAKEIMATLEEGLKQWDGINNLKYHPQSLGFNYLALRQKDSFAKVLVSVTTKIDSIKIFVTWTNKIHMDTHLSFDNPEDTLIKISEHFAREMV